MQTKTDPIELVLLVSGCVPLVPGTRLRRFSVATNITHPESTKDAAAKPVNQFCASQPANPKAMAEIGPATQ
ncbi:MAG TPA: hypothetical protein VHN77_14690 [Phycisphaerales bacterium]|nr:hypothetical protein [Phycisphaerales bacterium]